MKVINRFFGNYRFLSNFWPCRIKYEGLVYPSVEHAYQAAKTLDCSEKLKICEAKTPGQAKRMGCTLRSDWEEIKLNVMLDLLRLKFSIPELKEKLLLTEDALLVEGNEWGDVFWGVWEGRGENNLGKLLMKVRGEIK
jgi:N-glycosidase YbiA